MSKRKTVKLNIDFVKIRIKQLCRSNVVFCEKMGRTNHPTWVSDWCRTPPKNLPSPEEAARMCAILQVMPEEILTEPEDIELVKTLIESQRPERQKEADPLGGTDFKPTKEYWEKAVSKMSKAEMREVMDILMKKYVEDGE